MGQGGVATCVPLLVPPHQSSLGIPQYNVERFRCTVHNLQLSPDAHPAARTVFLCVLFSFRYSRRSSPTAASTPSSSPRNVQITDLTTSSSSSSSSSSGTRRSKSKASKSSKAKATTASSSSYVNRHRYVYGDGSAGPGGVPGAIEHPPDHGDGDIDAMIDAMMISPRSGGASWRGVEFKFFLYVLVFDCLQLRALSFRQRVPKREAASFTRCLFFFWSYSTFKSLRGNCSRNFCKRRISNCYSLVVVFTKMSPFDRKVALVRSLGACYDYYVSTQRQVIILATIST